MRRARPIVEPADAHKLVASILDQVIASNSGLAGFTYGTEIDLEDMSDGIPDRFIRYEIVGSAEAHRVGDRPSMRVQVWQDGNEPERIRTANIILAFLRARGARLEAGPVSVPDPVDAFRPLAQFEVGLLLIGTPLTP